MFRNGPDAGLVAITSAVHVVSTRGRHGSRLLGKVKSGVTARNVAEAGADKLAADKIAAAAGDFEAMVRVYRQRIFRFAFASLRDSDAADTITQDCFLKAFRNWAAFRKDCSLDTWLMQIAVNLIRDHGRNRRWQFWKRTRLKSEPVELGHNRIDRIDRIAASSRNPESQMLLNEQVSAVWQAAHDLPERQRTAFLLRFVEDMDILEIAAVTGLREGTVKAHLFSAIRNVRKRIGAAP